jgi:hypothetical protein
MTVGCTKVLNILDMVCGYHFSTANHKQGLLDRARYSRVHNVCPILRLPLQILGGVGLPFIPDVSPAY